MALTQMARSVSHLLRSGAELRLHQFRQPFEEETAIYQNGDAPNSHVLAPERKAPSFLHTLRMVERAYSLGADVRLMMAIAIIDVNTQVPQLPGEHSNCPRLAQRDFTCCDVGNGAGMRFDRPRWAIPPVA